MADVYGSWPLSLVFRGFIVFDTLWSIMFLGGIGSCVAVKYEKLKPNICNIIGDLKKKTGFKNAELMQLYVYAAALSLSQNSKVFHGILEEVLSNDI